MASKEDKSFFVGVFVAVIAALSLYFFVGLELGWSTLVGVVIGMVTGLTTFESIREK